MQPLHREEQPIHMNLLRDLQLDRSRDLAATEVPTRFPGRCKPRLGLRCGRVSCGRAAVWKSATADAVASVPMVMSEPATKKP